MHMLHLRHTDERRYHSPNAVGHANDQIAGGDAEQRDEPPTGDRSDGGGTASGARIQGQGTLPCLVSDGIEDERLPPWSIEHAYAPDQEGEDDNRPDMHALETVQP